MQQSRNEKFNSPVIIRFEGAGLIQTQVFGLLITQLCQVGIETRQMQTGHIFVWK